MHLYSRILSLYGGRGPPTEQARGCRHCGRPRAAGVRLARCLISTAPPPPPAPQVLIILLIYKQDAAVVLSPLSRLVRAVRWGARASSIICWLPPPTGACRSPLGERERDTIRASLSALAPLRVLRLST